MKILRSTAGIPVLSMILAGCGGSGDPRSVEEFSPTPQAPEYRVISGTVSGLNGSLTLSWAGNSQILGGGAFSIANAFEAGDSFDLEITSEPLSQRCTIDSATSFTAREDDVTGVSVSCVTMNLVRIGVENFFTGEPMAGVDLTATWDQGSGRQNLTGTSDEDGELVLEVPTFDGRIVVNADPDDFGEQSKVVLNTTTPAGRAVRMLMLPANLDTTFEAADGMDLAVGGDVLISIPANALVDSGGSPYTGTVAVELTVVDPTVDTDIMPGDYISQAPGGATAPIQSYGALSLTLTGSDGEVLDLTTGQVADIHIPVAEAEQAGPPATVPLFHYDPQTGYWIEEGSADLATLGSGLQVYSGEVAHFTTWNADLTYTPVLVQGCVVDTTGAPAGNVSVVATGASYLGSSRDVTDSDGQFAVPVRPQAQLLVTVGDGLQSGTTQVTTTTTDTTITDCLVASAGSTTINLTWGENPTDLDTRLYGFSAADSSEDFEVNYTQRTATAGAVTIDLDVDDVTGFGPEVVTFPDFPYAGVYRYAVHLFSGSGTIADSPARVELNLRGDVTVYSPPAGTPTACWAVLDLEVDEFGNVTVVPLASWETESYCTSGDFTRPAGAGTQSAAASPATQGLSVGQPANPLMRAIRQKYYAD